MLSPSSLWKKAPSDFLATGIGSLPHPYIDAALQFSFSHTIPFLPQLPARHPGEFMVAQALEGLPGMSAEPSGLVEVDMHVWEAQSDRLGKALAYAFSAGDSNWSAFERFEPTPAHWSCWTPFIWELNERAVSFAKIQIAGPLTCQWAMRPRHDQKQRCEGLSMQVYRLVMARAISMCRRLRSVGVVPLLFLDEPGLYGFSSSDTRQKVALEELRIFIQTLRKEESLVGIHCCSNTEWPGILELPIDVLSIDVGLSLPFLLTEPGLGGFLQRGGRLALGIIPTGSHALKLRSLEPLLLWQSMKKTIQQQVGQVRWIRQLLTEAIYTPACGLALHSVEDAEAILSQLNEFASFVKSVD